MPTIYENEGMRRAMMENYHRTVWKIAEWRRDPRCRRCGKVTHNVLISSDWKNKSTVDHIICRALNGSDTEENFEMLCGECNNKKSKLEAKLLEFIRQKAPLTISSP